MSHHFDTPTTKEDPRINTALGDGVAPDTRLMRPDFPYFGEPHPTAASAAKQ